MFRKIVSNIAFSPALVGQLGFYAKRLRKEELTRRLGLVFTALALVVQFFAVFSPPVPANAASPADFISGGIDNKDQLLRHYDNNTNRIRGLFTSLGITREELAGTTRGSIKKAEVPGKYNWSRTSLYSAAQGQRDYTFHNGEGNVTFYYRPLSLTQEGTLPYPVLEGRSAKFGWFAIKLDCGNLITPKAPPAPQYCPYNPALLANNPTCTPPPEKTPMCPYNPALPLNSPDCKAPVCQYNPSLPPTSPDCKPPEPPAAVCSSLNALVTNRTLVALSGSATTKGGATVSKYVFTIKDSTGKVVKTVPVDSTQLAVSAPSFELATPGTYSVTLAVTTSVGEKADATNCVKSFTIAKPLMCTYNPTLPANSPDCQPCDQTSGIWIKDEKCKADIIRTKTALDISRGTSDFSKTAARAGDRISYTVVVENRGLAEDTVTMTEDLGDVLEYAKLVDAGGGEFKEADNSNGVKAKTLQWSNVKVAPKSKQSRTFVVQLMDPIPTTNTGASNGASYDCVMTNTFGNSIDISVECPVEKAVVERTVTELPHTGPRENIIFAVMLLSIVVYFYARSRQLGKEVRLIRRSVHAGAI